MLVNNCFPLSILVFFFSFIVTGIADEKVSVVLLFRGGHRTIISSYPNDPYQNSSFWPDGYGRLYLGGKKFAFMLGQFYRAYYFDYISPIYKKSETLAYASDVDRSLMSAALFMDGFYRLEKENQWTPDLFWEPVPIHTRPVKEDSVLAQAAPCPRKDKLIEEQKNSESYEKINKENAELFEFLSNKTGWKVDDIEYIEKLYSIMYIYSDYNEDYIPDWYKSLDQDHLKYLAGVSMARRTSTTELKRLVAGPLLDFLFNYFDQVIANTAPKFMILSAHGDTVASFLNTMGYFKLHPPEFINTVMLEMYKRDDGTFYVTMTYKSPDFPGLDPFSLDDCDSNCDYKIYKKLLRDVTIGGDDCRKECSKTTEI